MNSVWAIREPSAIHPGWKTEILLKEELGIPGDADELDYEGTKKAARRAYEILEHWRQSDVPSRHNIDAGELEWIADEFHTLGFVDDEPATSEFDAVMNALYDWADDERVVIR